jgi:hypothetical protein
MSVLLSASSADMTLDIAAEAPTFYLGLPYVSQGPLLNMARALGASVLVSANGFSKWTIRDGYRKWARFRLDSARLLYGMDACLDSAGFVATRRYGAYPWTVHAYLDLCAAYPWRYFAAMDYCVEPEIAGDRATVLDRISMTVHSLFECRRFAIDRGIGDRLMPVVQGWDPSDYARCLSRMRGAVEEAPILGVGSVCRRPAHGPNGVVAIVDRIHDELGSLPIRLHLFGVKSDAASILRDHPRVASLDSQAYGVQARVLAREGNFSKTNAFLASVMEGWYLRQRGSLCRPARPMEARPVAIPFDPDPAPEDHIDRRVAAAREEIRELVEAGEIDASWLNPLRALEWAFDDDDSDNDRL